MVGDGKIVPEEGSDGKANYNLLQGKLLTSPAPGEEIVVSGAAGAFPASRTIEEFKNNLFNKVSMVTPNRRWGNIHAEIPHCSGTIPEIETFDAGFFGIHERQGHWHDTMCRLILEKTIEAIFDAGLHPSELENTKTGVFIGACFSESEKTIFFDQQLPQRYGFLGVSRNMLAHRISYYLKLKGPSFVTDTACSSSLYALEHAFRSLRLGEVDTAIVGGINLCLHPLVSLQFARLGVLSIDGSCKVFDEAADGYARSETVGILILQKAKVAKRKYAEIIHVKTNCDGFKENGITFPSKIAQQTLLEEFYDECGVDRYSLSYLEAHGTGTSVGDPEETSAVDEVLTKGRKTHLLIGSVKSNIGHSEPSSGIASIVKCIIGLETGIIPPNSHFKKPNQKITGLMEGRLKVVSEPMPFEDDRGLIGINSFGFGGGNCHTLLRKNQKEKLNSGLPSDNIPRLICLSGRTEEGIISLLDEVKNNVLDAEYIRLLHNIFRFAIPNQLFRGFAIVSKSGEICRFLDRFRNDFRPLYLGFGELNNWYHIGNNLLALPEFSNSIQRIQEKLPVIGFNITDTFQKDSIDRETYHILGSVAVQIGLIDLFKVLKINPKDYFGFSFGELVCAYANGISTLEDIMNCAFIINESINKVADFYETGKGKKHMNSSEVPSLDKIREKLKAEKSAIIRNQVLQNLTNFMRSSSINIKLTKQTLAITDYFVDCLANDALQNFEKIESMSIFLTLGKFPADENIGEVEVTQLFSSQNANHLEEFLKLLGHLYIGGHDQHLSYLYPEIELPVSRGTKMISPYIKWKHDSRQWFTPLYDLVAKKVAQQGARTVNIQLSDLEWSFIDGHVIDGRNLFPATGYLYLVWETLCIIEDRPLNILHVVFENCKFMRATTIPTKGVLKLKVVLNTVSGNFEILEGDSTVMSGRMYETYEGVDEPIYGTRSDGSHLTMKTKDIYKELTLRGYNYKGEFRSIVECNASATEGRIRWHDNWVSFLDNMLQMKILGTDSRLLYVPTFIERIMIPGKQLTKWIIDEFNEKGLEPILPVYSNKESGEIRCGQTVIRGLIASSIARRKDLGVPVLEKYIFVPNITTLELQESVRINMQVFLENSMVYKVKVIELIDEFTKDINTPLIPTIKTVFGDQPLIQTLPKILSSEVLDVTIPVENKNLAEEKDCLLIVVSRLFERPEILQTAFSSLKENGFIISRESSDFSISDTKKLDVTVCTVHNVGLETHVLLKRNHKPRNSVALEVNSFNDFSWIEKTQELIKNKSSDSVILYSDNRDRSGVLGLVNCLRREPESSHVKCLFVMDDDRDINFEDPLYSEQLKKNMAINVFKDGVWGTYRHLLAEDTDQVQNEHCFANPRIRGDLSSLSWFEGPLRHDMCIPPERQLVSVYYASLNFRDVMTASGKINADIVTSDRIDQECVQGFEYSGLDSEGNKIMGMVTHGALSSYVLIDNYIAFSVPDNFSLEEAATIPVVYGTVIYGLILRAQLKRGESILIHSGTGGVGQAAIRIALHYGCKIYTTVGTEEKREFLKQTFPSLKDHHIGNSRDTSFEKLVMRGTKGRGVDLVLNSLAEEKLQASIRCLAKGGRFVEIGKFDMGKNADCHLLLLERECSFHGVMVDQLMPLVPCEKARVAAIIEKGMEEGFVQPLNRTVFEYDQLEDAFRYMSTGKHMGKVLIKMREPEKRQKAIPTVLKFPCRARYSCTDTDAYIICGGLGGFGLELADWLVLRGARILVLTSRKGISTGYQQYRINIWRSYGVTVHICKANITTKEGCRSLIEEARQLGDVKAIFNLAVVLADAIFENQTQESFATSFGPKAVATKYLDEISRELCPNLSDFVIFSSVTCGRGNGGQTNYGMANSVMERICEQRMKDGYPAVAIQWGAIGQVGLVAEMQEIDCELEIGGTLQQKITNCLNVLDGFLKQKKHAILSSIVVAEKRGMDYADNIVDAVISILGVSSSKMVSHHATLAELGMDSMTAVEIKQTLEREFEVFLSAKDMRTMTLAKLKKMQEDRSADIGEQIDKPSANFPMDMIFRIYGDEKELTCPYLQFETDQKKNSSSTVILLPGIDGFARVFETIAKNLEYRSIALQYTYRDKAESIVEMAQLLIPVIEEQISREKHFTIIAYSFGSVVALEVANLLESKNYKGTVILIDGTPAIAKQIFTEINAESPEILETYLLSHLLSFYLPSSSITQHQESLLKCPSWDARLEMTNNLVGERASYGLASRKLIANGIYNRLKAMGTYTPSYNKVKSTVKLFKPAETNIRGYDEDYGLSAICEQPVDIEVFDGNHVTVLDNLKLVSTLNDLIDANNLLDGRQN